MSYYQTNSPVRISIPEVINEDNVTFYDICVEVGSVRWSVRHRYNDFSILHDKLVEEGVSRDTLPPKKLLGSKDPGFIMRRRRELEAYMQNVFHFLAQDLPPVLADFLAFPKYDINFILRNLAGSCHDEEMSEQTLPDGEMSCTAKTASWTPLELFAISERLKNPCPPLDPESKRYDFTNVADFCCRLEKLHLLGEDNELGTSNIRPNQLNFDFLAFKSLTEITIENLSSASERIKALSFLRSTLQLVTIRGCGLQSVADLLMGDSSLDRTDSAIVANTSLKWPVLRYLDLSDNNLQSIELFFRLASKISELILDNNNISSIENLSGLPFLRRLSLARNQVSLYKDLHTVLGQVTDFNLDHNNLRNLETFSRLYSLQKLSVSHNKIKTLDDIRCVCRLPCLEELVLENNPLTNIVDYRLKVLEAVGSRCGEVRLDHVMTSSSELDKVSILMALSVSREKKSPISLFGNLPNSEKVS